MTESLRGRRPLILRRQRPGDDLMDALCAAGAHPLELPVMRIRPLPAAATHPSLDAVFAAPQQFTIAVFTSPYVAELVLAHLRQRHQGLPTCWRWVAVGQATADRLRQAGLEVLAPGCDMTSEGVLALPELQSVAGQRLVIFRGEGGRRLMDQEFAARGALITSCPLYRREPDPTHADTLCRAIDDHTFDALVVHSGELLDILATLLPAGALSRLLHHPLVVPAERVADKARRLGAERVVVAANAGWRAMVSALARCYS